MRSFNSFLGKSIAASIILIFCQSASAQLTARQGNNRVIEEVIVSAQKRDEALQDVPISMSVMTGDFMVEQGVTDLREALLYVPNVQVEQAGFFSAPRARGFTFNNSNKAFEPPLGIAVDGIPYTRIPYFLAATFDLNRIEVLRGPQGTTFGKNTTAGLIHMLTADPQDDFEAALSAQTGEENRRRYEMMLSGPVINDVVLVRFAAFDDKRDGFMDNTTDAIVDTAQSEFRGHDRNGMRLKFLFPDLAGSQFKIAFEKVKLADLGTGIEIIQAPDSVKEFLRGYDPNTDFTADNYVASLDAPDGREVVIRTVSSEWSYAIDDWSLILVAGHSALKQYFTLDTDFSPAPATWGQSGDTSPTTTAELRIVSPPLQGLFGLKNLFNTDLGSSDFVAGLFYQQRAMKDSYFRFTFDMPAYLGLTIAADANLDPASPLFGIIAPPRDSGFVEDTTQIFNQDAEALAVFAEFKWHFSDTWTLQLGVRNDNETKTASWNQFFNQPQPAIILPQAGLDAFTAEREMEDSEFQHKIALNWQPSDNVSLFIHRAEGVKGGGFNAFAFRDVDDELQFGAEYTTEWSFNAKTNWLDNSLQANISVFRMDVEDFQVLTRDPGRTNIGLGVTLVRNAAEARSQGLEGDIQWLPTNWLTFIATVGYNDTEYLDFVGNECAPDQSDDPACGDATGKSFPFAPEWNNTYTGIVRTPLWDSGLELTASATIEQVSSQYLDLDLDERKRQESFERYKASIGLSNPEHGWSLKLIGENLSNKATGIRQGDLFSGIIVEIAEAPRTFYAQFNWHY